MLAGTVAAPCGSQAEKVEEEKEEGEVEFLSGCSVAWRRTTCGSAEAEGKADEAWPAKQEGSARKRKRR